jgi:glutathione S-transferase
MVAKELGVELELRTVDLLAREQDSPDYRKKFPEGLVPSLDDNGFYLWEGGAIMTYLVDKYSPGHSLYPTDPQSRAHVHRFLHFDNGSLFPSVRTLTSPMYQKGLDMDPVNETACRQKVALLDQALEGKSYLVGENRTLADLTCYSTIGYLASYGLELEEYPNLGKWLTRLREEMPFDREVNEKPIENWRKFLLDKKLIKPKA